jgi:hypothetical protein
MKLHWTTVFNFAVAVALAGYGVLVYANLREHRGPFENSPNGAKWNAVYGRAREAYKAAAELRDADDTRYVPKYREAYDTYNAADLFSRQELNEPASTAAQTASRDLAECLTTLAIFHNPSNFPKLRDELRRQIDHCEAYGDSGFVSDKK